MARAGKECPNCGVKWESEVDMPTQLRRYNPDYYPNRKAAEEAARDYGWTPENDKRFGINHFGVEDPMVYDGVIYWECTHCQGRVPRFPWVDV